MKKNGFTLVELLIATVLFSVLAAVISWTFLVGLRVWNSGSIRAELRQSANLSMERMVRELSAASVINTAKSDEVDFDADLDGNGVAETIKFDVSNDDILERTEDKASVTMARDVQAFTLGYYLDGNNDDLESPVTGPRKNDIRVIVITLTLNNGDETFTLSSGVYIRNQEL